MERKSKLYIRDILDSIDKIEGYVKGLTFKKFSQNQMVIDAVVRNFEIIGEASKKLPAKIKSSHSEIPWKEMAGMRNKMIHEYFGVDLKIVWKTVKQSLPDLKKLLENIS